MKILKLFFLGLSFLHASYMRCNLSLAEQFKEVGYKELYDQHQGKAAYTTLYRCFDELIDFLQANPVWAQKLYTAKERFIRSKQRKYYGTDFFGLYDESRKSGRQQISFYYSVHFHDFLFTYFPEFKKIYPLTLFFDICRVIQNPYGTIFDEAATALGVPTLFASDYNRPPILLKVIKYFPEYVPAKPHYDGTAFSLFLDSTDNQSLLLSSYKDLLVVEDFATPVRTYERLDRTNSIVLIPGTLVTDYALYPTPHIVLQSSTIRYATIAFAMRPNYQSQKNEFAVLPNFKP